MYWSSLILGQALHDRFPHDRIGAFYNLIDVLVYSRPPIRLTELVTPLKPLEAMADAP
jgi:glycogen synthase